MRLNESASSSWLLRALSCAGCGVIALWGMGLLLGTMLAPYRLVGQTATCSSNLHRLTRAFALYADDYQDSYPLGERWNPALTPYLDGPDRLHCPTVRDRYPAGFGYAMDSERSAQSRIKIDVPGKAALAYDSSNLAANAHDPVMSLPRPGRHRAKPARGQPIRAGNNVGYADGSVRVRYDSSAGAPSALQEDHTDAAAAKRPAR